VVSVLTPALVESRPQHGSKLALEFFKDEFELNWEMGRFGKPYVAIIDGFTMGGGAGISLPAQIRVATKKTVFAMPETKIGYSPDVGGNYYIAQLDGEVGAWLAITGQEVWGRAAYELGIATHYVEPENIPAMVEQLKQLENPTLDSVASIVAAYHVPAPEGAAVSSKESREGPSPITGAVRTFLDKTFGLGSIQEIYAALKAAEADASLAPEVQTWAKQQREVFDNRSPTGMAVALANYKLAKAAKRLNTALENDILMATGFVGNDRPTEEFTTGVTHVLITRGKGRAEWNPSDINDAKLTPAAIKKTFLDASAPHMSELPKLIFNPAPTTKEGPDSTWGKFRSRGLPAEDEVKAWVQGEAHGSGAFKLKENELINAVLDSRGERGGPREKEIVARVKATIALHTKADGDKYLDWVN
jgi:3-hydroxyisobutyryl-CoA hydrolase